MYDEHYSLRQREQNTQDSECRVMQGNEDCMPGGKSLPQGTGIENSATASIINM